MSNIKANGKAVWSWINHDPYNHLGESIISGRDSKHRINPIEHVRVGDDYQGWFGIIDRLIQPVPTSSAERASNTWATLWAWVHDGGRL